ncbi:MAG: hypothetical protein L6R42_007965 [Xanthoria sp. 1 TBL-2021]|nr:MAG: hypothetical protein L6R42_007965 [Xanthoria sp. 1 TBL-2021]
MHYPTILSVALTTLSFTTSVLTNAIPNPVGLAPARRAEAAEAIPFPFDEAQAGYLESALRTIEDIPDSVLDDGPEAVTKWANEHQPNIQLAVRSELTPRQGWAQIAKCAFAIGKAIAENAFPISKLRRLRELVKVLGGAKEVAKMLLKAKTIKQMIIIGGPELQEIAYILLGVTEVVNDCFSF